MIQTPSPFPPGCLAVLTGDTGRYTDFMLALLATAVPEGSNTFIAKGAEKVQQRNHAVAAALSRPEFDWLWFLDDDQTFAADHLLFLLAKMYGGPEYDVLGSVYCTKHPPFNPVGAYLLATDYRSLTWGDLPRFQNELTHPALALGTGGLLIRRRVLEKMPAPWFEVGQIRTDKEHEDLYFSTKCQRLAVKVALDVERCQVHMLPIGAGAERKDGAWISFLEFNMPSGPRARLGLDFSVPMNGIRP